MKDSITVKKDQWIPQGKMIGKSGNTGNSSDPHLHFDLRAYWNSGYPTNDMGPTIPVIFEDKNHVGWRAKVGDELHSNNDYTLQEDWRWCNKCQGLFFGGNAGSKCPADSKAHTKIGSGNYVLVGDSPNASGQQDWRWCNKCPGLFFGGNAGSKCPLGKKDRKMFDEMMSYPRLNNSAGSNACRPVLIHPILMSIIFEHYKLDKMRKGFLIISKLVSYT
jgi:hypothetical protein